MLKEHFVILLFPNLDIFGEKLSVLKESVKNPGIFAHKLKLLAFLDKRAQTGIETICH